MNSKGLRIITREIRCFLSYAMLERIHAFELRGIAERFTHNSHWYWRAQKVRKSVSIDYKFFDCSSSCSWRIRVESIRRIFLLFARMNVQICFQMNELPFKGLICSAQNIAWKSIFAEILRFRTEFKYVSNFFSCRKRFISDWNELLMEILSFIGRGL